MTRDSFIFLGRYMKSFAKLDMVQRGLLITAMMNYQIGEDLPEMDAITDMAFSFIKDDMDYNNQKYDEKCERNRENGKKGGRPKANGFLENPKKANGFLENPTKPTKTLSESESESESDKEDICRDVIDYLNQSLGTKYTTKNKTNMSHINARAAEGHTLDDFKRVIDKKVAQWKDDPKMSAYLRPETLFCSKHFESYLNEIVDVKEKKGSTLSDVPQSTYDKIHNFPERDIDYESIKDMFGI